MLLIFAGLALIILDQAVKGWVVRNIAFGSADIPLIPGVLSLTRVHNDGAAFSFLSGGNAKWLFIALALLFAAAVFTVLTAEFVKGKTEKICLAMMAAGGPAFAMKAYDEPCRRTVEEPALRIGVLGDVHINQRLFAFGDHKGPLYPF